MTRRKFTPEFKTKVVLEALKERKTAAQLAQQFDISPQQISLWKRDFLASASKVFESKPKSKKELEDEQTDKLLKVIGQQKVEIDFLKKALM
ncbi:transposase [Portibacter marinus]|uniref:transposase n=1 Tax=Portibacter marinus TaxID=2898660 RepID=UPI001F2C606C|nr:transposase [Portibacter marinus]